MEKPLRDRDGAQPRVVRLNSQNPVLHNDPRHFR